MNECWSNREIGGEKRVGHRESKRRTIGTRGTFQWGISTRDRTTAHWTSEISETLRKLPTANLTMRLFFSLLYRQRPLHYRFVWAEHRREKERKRPPDCLLERDDSFWTLSTTHVLTEKSLWGIVVCVFWGSHVAPPSQRHIDVPSRRTGLRRSSSSTYASGSRSM